MLCKHKLVLFGLWSSSMRRLQSKAQAMMHVIGCSGRTSEYSRRASSTRPRWKALLPACRSLALLALCSVAARASACSTTGEW